MGNRYSRPVPFVHRHASSHASRSSSEPQPRAASTRSTHTRTSSVRRRNSTTTTTNDGRVSQKKAETNAEGDLYSVGSEEQTVTGHNIRSATEKKSEDNVNVHAAEHQGNGLPSKSTVAAGEGSNDTVGLAEPLCIPLPDSKEDKAVGMRRVSSLSSEDECHTEATDIVEANGHIVVVVGAAKQNNNTALPLPLVVHDVTEEATMRQQEEGSGLLQEALSSSVKPITDTTGVVSEGKAVSDKIARVEDRQQELRPQRSEVVMDFSQAKMLYTSSSLMRPVITAQLIGVVHSSSSVEEVVNAAAATTTTKATEKDAAQEDTVRRTEELVAVDDVIQYASPSEEHQQISNTDQKMNVGSGSSSTLTVTECVPESRITPRLLAEAEEGTVRRVSLYSWSITQHEAMSNVEADEEEEEEEEEERPYEEEEVEEVVDEESESETSGGLLMPELQGSPVDSIPQQQQSLAQPPSCASALLPGATSNVPPFVPPLPFHRLHRRSRRESTTSARSTATTQHASSLLLTPGRFLQPPLPPPPLPLPSSSQNTQWTALSPPLTPHPHPLSSLRMRPVHMPRAALVAARRRGMTNAVSRHHNLHGRCMHCDKSGCHKHRRHSRTGYVSPPQGVIAKAPLSPRPALSLRPQETHPSHVKSHAGVHYPAHRPLPLIPHYLRRQRQRQQEEQQHDMEGHTHSASSTPRHASTAPTMSTATATSTTAVMTNNTLSNNNNNGASTTTTAAVRGVGLTPHIVPLSYSARSVSARLSKSWPRDAKAQASHNATHWWNGVGARATTTTTLATTMKKPRRRASHHRLHDYVCWGVREEQQARHPSATGASSFAEVLSSTGSPYMGEVLYESSTSGSYTHSSNSDSSQKRMSEGSEHAGQAADMLYSASYTSEDEISAAAALRNTIHNRNTERHSARLRGRGRYEPQLPWSSYDTASHLIPNNSTSVVAMYEAPCTVLVAEERMQRMLLEMAEQRIRLQCGLRLCELLSQVELAHLSFVVPHLVKKEEEESASVVREESAAATLQHEDLTQEQNHSTTFLQGVASVSAEEVKDSVPQTKATNTTEDKKEGAILQATVDQSSEPPAVFHHHHAYCNLCNELYTAHEHCAVTHELHATMRARRKRQKEIKKEAQELLRAGCVTRAVRLLSEHGLIPALPESAFNHHNTSNSNAGNMTSNSADISHRTSSLLSPAREELPGKRNTQRQSSPQPSPSPTRQSIWATETELTARPPPPLLSRMPHASSSPSPLAPGSTKAEKRSKTLVTQTGEFVRGRGLPLLSPSPK